MTRLALQSYNICCLSLWDGNVLTRSAFFEVKVSGILYGTVYVYYIGNVSQQCVVRCRN